MCLTTIPIVASSNFSHILTNFVNSVVGYEMSRRRGPVEPARGDLHEGRPQRESLTKLTLFRFNSEANVECCRVHSSGTFFALDVLFGAFAQSFRYFSLRDSSDLFIGYAIANPFEALDERVC
jgi:hypothetical protein